MGNAIVIKPLRADAHGPFDIGEHLRNRQAALAVDAEFLGFLDDLRIDEKERRANAFAGFLVLVLKIDDPHALGNADLDRGKTDAGGIVNRLQHVLHTDRQSSVYGKSESERVIPGGLGIIQKKKQTKKQ